MPIVKAFFWRVFYYLENLCDWLAFKFDVPPLHFAASWVGTIAFMMDEQAMRSLRISMAQARYRKALTYEEVFGHLADDFSTQNGEQWPGMIQK